VLLFSFVSSPIACCEVNLESSSAEVTPLTSACYPTPEPAQVVFELVLRHSCSVSGLDEGVLRKRLLLLFLPNLCQHLPWHTNNRAVWLMVLAAQGSTMDHRELSIRYKVSPTEKCTRRMFVEYRMPGLERALLT